MQLEVENLFGSAVPKICKNVRAIISPHAGFVFSGGVAASVFNQIDSGTVYKRVFIIASSHHESFEGAAVYCDGDFVMPFGKVAVDSSFCKMLTEKFPHIITADRSPHQNEHSLEVQLPFLNYALKTEYHIVPIIVGTSDPNVCKEIACLLKPYFTSENLFIISSDFSHYPNYADGRIVDAATKEAILTNNPAILLTTLKKNAAKHIPHLVTSLCGWTSVLTLLYMTADNDSFEYSAIDYKNSGDAEDNGDIMSVVGYWGIAVTEKSVSDDDFLLSDSEKGILLSIARESIESIILRGKKSKMIPADFSTALNTKCGAFVSLHKKDKLRGCLGRLVGDLPLCEMVQEMAASAAVHDFRFSSVVAGELSDIKIEISALSPLRMIKDISEIQLGKHGIFIEKAEFSGVFLPQVATETGWSKEEFLGHCAADKAGLGWNGWKSADIYVFTATVFS